MQLNIIVDDATFNSTRYALGDMERKTFHVLSAAINETAKEVKTLISKEIRQVLTLNKEATDKRIKIWPVASPQSLNSTVRLSWEKVPGLISFGATGHRAGEPLKKRQAKGVKYKVSKQGGTRRIKEAFIATKRGQTHENVFFRKFVGGKQVGRKPLIRPRGVSPWGVIAYRPGVLERIQNHAVEALPKNVNQRITSTLGGFVKQRRAA